MRDPERIKTVLKLIEKVWIKNPDLRLCQLIGNCFTVGDLYHIEDDVLEESIKSTYPESIK